MKLWKNRLMGCALAGMLSLGAVSGTVVPARSAEAGGVLVDVLGTAIAGTMYRDKVMGSTRLTTIQTRAVRNGSNK